MIESSKSSEALRAKATETRENIAEMSHLAKEAVQHKLHGYADRASESYSAGKDKLHSLEKGFVDKVQDAPLKALMIAAGVGLLLGLFVRRS